MSWAAPHSFKANGFLYLAIQNMDPSDDLNAINSYIYRWDGTMFVHHQDIATLGDLNLDSFMTADGHVFLGTAKAFVQSAVYKMANNKFNLYQKLSTTGTAYVHAFTHKGKAVSCGCELF